MNATDYSNTTTHTQTLTYGTGFDLYDSERYDSDERLSGHMVTFDTSENYYPDLPEQKIIEELYDEDSEETFDEFLKRKVNESTILSSLFKTSGGKVFLAVSLTVSLALVGRYVYRRLSQIDDFVKHNHRRF